MKKISILIHCFNEKDNLIPMYEAVTKLMAESLSSYDYELVFIDNASTDGTRELLRGICSQDKHVHVILNARNFGMFNSQYHGMLQTSGDCTIMLYCDFQEPLELIPDMVKAWEEGSRIVVMQKTKSRENRLMYFVRTCYYKLMQNFSDIEQIEHFTGFGLYDKSFIQLMRDLRDPMPFLRGIVAEFGYKIKIIHYTQQKRRAGKTHFNFLALYDAAMYGFTAYTKLGLRAATLLGFLTGIGSTFAGLVYLIAKILWWDSFSVGLLRS